MAAAEAKLWSEFKRFVFIVLWLSASSALAGCEQHSAASSDAQL
jgi:hypothetical protein